MKHATLIIIVWLINSLWQPTSTHAASTVCHPDQPTICVVEPFLHVWQSGGGLQNYGYPVALPQQMRLGTTQFTAQLFERARIEIHGENSSTQTVHLGRIGAEVMTQQGLHYDPAAPNPECRYIAETQHNICGSFLQYWQQPTSATLTSIQRWGYPLSEAQVMTLEDGSDVIAQWFERGRFELHAETSPPQIMVTRLGALFPDTTAGNTIIEHTNTQLTASGLTHFFDVQETASPILDLRMTNAKNSLEQAYYLYIERLEKQLFHNYISQIISITGADQCSVNNIRGYANGKTYPIDFCLYTLLTDTQFGLPTNDTIDSSVYVSGTKTAYLFYYCADVAYGCRKPYYSGIHPASQLVDSSYIEKFAVYECGLQNYPNKADFLLYGSDNPSSYEIETPNQTEIQICATLRFAMQFAGVNELRLVKSALSNRILTQFLQQSLFTEGDANTSTDIAYIQSAPAMVVAPTANLATDATIPVGQTFPITASMSLFWDSDIYVSLPTALDKMHVTVHATEFATFDDAYQWYRYPRWVEPYMTVTSDDVLSDSNNRLPQMTRLGTGMFEGQYVAYQHLLRNNRSYYIVVKGHNQLATWSLADRIALLIDANEPVNAALIH